MVFFEVVKLLHVHLMKQNYDLNQVMLNVDVFLKYLNIIIQELIILLDYQKVIIVQVMDLVLVMLINIVEDNEFHDNVHDYLI